MFINITDFIAFKCFTLKIISFYVRQCFFLSVFYLVVVWIWFGLEMFYFIYIFLLYIFFLNVFFLFEFVNREEENSFVLKNVKYEMKFWKCESAKFKPHRWRWFLKVKYFNAIDSAVASFIYISHSGTSLLPYLCFYVCLQRGCICTLL